MTKRARTWLLLLVALLLPFKGAMAAVGVFCHLGSAQPLSAIVAHMHDRHAAGEHSHHEHRQHAGDASHTQHTGDDGQPASDVSCAYCSAICGAPPLPAAYTSVVEVLPVGAERFPALTQPRLSAVLDGLDRPPRTT